VRRPISQLHPALYDLRVAELRLARRLRDRVNDTPFATTLSEDRLPIAMVRHGLLMRRQLLNLDFRLQETKIVNLRLAAAAMDGLLIRPGEVFSFWNRVGPPTAARGFDYGDLRLGNPRGQAFQLRVSVGSTHLRGVIATERAWPFTYHVEEHDHRFTRADDGSVYRDNELWRRVADRSTGRVVETSLLTRNHALVKYPVDAADLASIAVMAT
jgi:Uncharacterized vancomycin resistance protein